MSENTLDEIDIRTVIFITFFGSGYIFFIRTCETDDKVTRFICDITI